MPNYLESNVVGSKYVRCKSLHVSNPLNGVKYISMEEEQVIQLEDESISKPYSAMSKMLTEETANTTFDILNPEDNSVVSSMTYQDVYAVLYSLYMHSALERDAQEAAALAEMEATLANTAGV